MTLAPDAEILYDLRQAFRFPAVADTSAGDEGGAPSPPPSPADNAGSDDDEHDDDTGDEDEDVQNPRLKELSDENARRRREAKAEKDRADAAEARTTSLTDELQTARMENAFLRAAAGEVADTEAAWKLADKATLKVADDGTVTGADAAVADVVERYPYLVNYDDDDGVGTPPPGGSSGRPMNGKRKSGDAASSAVLRKKFPALGGRR